MRRCVGGSPYRRIANVATMRHGFHPHMDTQQADLGLAADPLHLLYYIVFIVVSGS